MSERYDQTGRRTLAMIWEAIANIPDRVMEIVALDDPGELRYVGWNPTSEQLELLEFSAADIPYDNSSSGLTAENVQEALDEVGTSSSDIIEFDAWINEAGTTGGSILPSGWTVSRPATGRYTLTHGFELEDYRRLHVFAFSQHTDEFMACEYINAAPNFFQIQIGRGAGVAANREFFLYARLLPEAA